MSLIVNGTTVEKVIVVKDSVSTNLQQLIVNGIVVFQTLLPPPVATKSFDQDLLGDIVSYGDIEDNTGNPYDGITEQIGGCSAILLTKYVANNGHPYQTMRRTYIGNKADGLPGFMDNAGYLEIMSTLGGFKHQYLPVDYYGPENPLPTISDAPIGCIPIMSSALAYIGASPVVVDELPHYVDFGYRTLQPIETGTYSNGKKNIFVFAETAEMKAFRNAHPDDLPEPFIVDSSTEIPESYLLFQPYDSTENIEDLISYYFGEYFSNAVMSNNRYGDVTSFYTNSGLEHNLSDANIIVMDSINSWDAYFNDKGIEWNTGNPFYDCADTVVEGSSEAFLGPWASPVAQWPEAVKNAEGGPALLMDKIPKGFNVGIYQNIRYPVLFGPQALAEALVLGLIPDKQISTGASENILNLTEVYDKFETDPIVPNIFDGATWNLDLYSVNNIKVSSCFFVGTKTA